MIRYSCERKDASRYEIPAEYTVMGKHNLPWDAGGVIDWHIHNWGEDIEPFHQVGIFAEAFNLWEQELFPCRFRSTADPEKADWQIYHAIKNKIHLKSGEVIDSPYDFIRAPEVLAVQYSYYPGSRWSLTMIVNDDHQFGVKHSGTIFAFQPVVFHEMGHGLRIGHSLTGPPNRIMAPTYNKNGVITDDERNAIRDVLGPQIKEFAVTLPNARRFMSLFAEGATELKTHKGCRPW